MANVSTNFETTPSPETPLTADQLTYARSMLDLSPNKSVIPVAIVMWVLALAAFGLRMTSRRISKAGFWWDDWLMVPALICATLLCYVPLAWEVSFNNFDTVLTPGTQSKVVTEADLFQYFKEAQEVTYSTEVCWAFAIASVKLSILALLWRLFSEMRGARLILRLLAVFVVVWGSCIGFMTIFQCSPLSDLWSLTESRHCFFSRTSFQIGAAVPHTASDLAMLILSIFWVWRLPQLQSPQKRAASLVFALGTFVTIISLIRLVYLVRAHSFYSLGLLYEGDGARAVIWSNVEVGLAIVCACLPSLRPVFFSMFTRIAAFKRKIDQQHDLSKRGNDLLQDLLPPSEPKEQLSGGLATSNHISDRDLEANSPHQVYDPSHHLPCELHAVQTSTPEMHAIQPRTGVIAIGGLSELSAARKFMVEMEAIQPPKAMIAKEDMPELHAENDNDRTFDVQTNSKTAKFIDSPTIISPMSPKELEAGPRQWPKPLPPTPKRSMKALRGEASPF